MPAYWGIAGYPVSHSLTPRLFTLVGEHLRMDEVIPIFLEARGIDEFTSLVGDLEERFGFLVLLLSSTRRSLDLVSGGQKASMRSISCVVRTVFGQESVQMELASWLLADTLA